MGRPNREQEIIERQVGHLVRLVDDLLDVSKITRGKIALRKEPVEIAGVIAKALEMASDLFEQRRHRLSIDAPAQGLRVEGDPVRLAQVIANLLTNAARYTEPGGLVSVRAFLDGSDVVVVVKDSGAGIAPDLLPRVFDLFVQGQRSTDRKEGGLGLGLALVRSLVELHGGTSVARSDGPGKGSEFEIRLPATARAADAVPAVRAPAAKAATASRRVLVVDDNVDSAELLREMLQWVGHEVAIAHDGPSALATAEWFAPDVAILDIGLPVMDGYELGRRLHERAAGCALPAHRAERIRAGARPREEQGVGLRGAPREARRRSPTAARRGRRHRLAAAIAVAGAQAFDLGAAERAGLRHSGRGARGFRAVHAKETVSEETAARHVAARAEFFSRGACRRDGRALFGLARPRKSGHAPRASARGGPPAFEWQGSRRGS